MNYWILSISVVSPVAYTVWSSISGKYRDAIRRLEAHCEQLDDDIAYLRTVAERQGERIDDINDGLTNINDGVSVVQERTTTIEHQTGEHAVHLANEIFHTSGSHLSSEINFAGRILYPNLERFLKEVTHWYQPGQNNAQDIRTTIQKYHHVMNHNPRYNAVYRFVMVMEKSVDFYFFPDTDSNFQNHVRGFFSRHFTGSNLFFWDGVKPCEQIESVEQMEANKTHYLVKQI